MGVELEADLSAKIGDLGETIRRISFSRYPYPYDWETTADATSATYTILPLFQAPVPAGRIYDVRRVAVAAAGTSGDPFTTLTGATAVLAKGSLMAYQGVGHSGQGRGFTSSSLDGSLNIILDPFAWDGSQGRVPATKTWSRGTLACKPNEQIFIIVKGATNGVHLYGIVAVELYPIEAFLNP